MTTLSLLVAMLAAIPLVVEAQDMRPGRYKTVARMEIPGSMMETVNDEICVTRDNIDEFLARLGGDKDPECKIADLERGPGAISYKVICVHPGATTVHETNGKFSSDSFDFNLSPKNEKAMKLNIKGTRIGECK